MRVTRAFLAGIGASTAMVAAGTLALLALSAVIAFRGWPAAGGSAGPSPQLMLSAAPVAGHAAAPAQATRVVLPATSTATAALARRGSGARRSAGTARQRAAARTIPGLASIAATPEASPGVTHVSAAPAPRPAPPASPAPASVAPVQQQAAATPAPQPPPTSAPSTPASTTPSVTVPDPVSTVQGAVGAAGNTVSSLLK
jgi:hypothetical protein